MSQGNFVGSNGSGDHCVYALAWQSLGNLAQAVIGSTQDSLELFLLYMFDNNILSLRFHPGDSLMSQIRCDCLRMKTKYKITTSRQIFNF